MGGCEEDGASNVAKMSIFQKMGGIFLLHFYSSSIYQGSLGHCIFLKLCLAVMILLLFSWLKILAFFVPPHCFEFLKKFRDLAIEVHLFSCFIFLEDPLSH